MYGKITISRYVPDVIHCAEPQWQGEGRPAVLVHPRADWSCDQHSRNAGTIPCRGTCCHCSLHLKFLLWLPFLAIFPSSFVSTLSTRPLLTIGSPRSLALPSLAVRMIMPFHGDDPRLNRAYTAATLRYLLAVHAYICARRKMDVTSRQSSFDPRTRCTRAAPPCAWHPPWTWFANGSPVSFHSYDNAFR